MNAQSLHNMREARDFLASLTGARVPLVGDPDDELPDMELESLAMARAGNSYWFKVKRHPTIDTWDRSATRYVETLRSLLHVSFDALLNGDETVKVKFTFDGYADDLRELREIEEVRFWMRKVFIEGAPQAIALLDDETFHLAKVCCNKVIRSVKTVGPRGSPAKALMQLTDEWRVACYLAGIDAEATF